MRVLGMQVGSGQTQAKFSRVRQHLRDWVVWGHPRLAQPQFSWNLDDFRPRSKSRQPSGASSTRAQSSSLTSVGEFDGSSVPYGSCLSIVRLFLVSSPPLPSPSSPFSLVPHPSSLPPPPPPRPFIPHQTTLLSSILLDPSASILLPPSSLHPPAFSLLRSSLAPLVRSSSPLSSPLVRCFPSIPNMFSLSSVLSSLLSLFSCLPLLSRSFLSVPRLFLGVLIYPPHFSSFCSSPVSSPIAPSLSPARH